MFINRGIWFLCSAVALAVCAGFTRADDGIDPRLILGTWAQPNAAQGDGGVTVELESSDRLRVHTTSGNQPVVFEGTYRVEGQTLEIVLPLDGNEIRSRVIITKLTADELVTSDPAGESTVMRRVRSPEEMRAEAERERARKLTAAQPARGPVQVPERQPVSLPVEETKWPKPVIIVVAAALLALLVGTARGSRGRYSAPAPSRAESTASRPAWVGALGCLVYLTLAVAALVALFWFS